MIHRWLGVLALMLSFTAAAAPPVEKALTIDTPIVELVLDPRTRPVLERLLPNLTERLLHDAAALDLLGGSSPRELALDPHVRGITDDLLERLQDGLLEAQKTPAQSH